MAGLLAIGNAPLSAEAQTPTTAQAPALLARPLEADARNCLKVAPDEEAAAKLTGKALVRLFRENLQAKKLLEEDLKGPNFEADRRQCLEAKNRILGVIASRLSPEQRAQADLQVELGELHLLSGRSGEALALLEKSARAAPRDLSTQRLFLRAARETQNLPFEIQATRNLLEIPPADATEWAEAFRRMRGRETARELFRRLPAFRKAFPQSRDLLTEEAELALELREGDRLNETARRMAGAGATPLDRLAGAYFEAQAWILKKDDRQALKSLRTFFERRAEAQKLDLSYSTEWERFAYRGLARQELRAKESSAALATALEALKIFPNDTTLTEILGQIAAEMRLSGRIPSAVSLEASLRSSPDSAPLKRLWIRALLEEKATDAALAQSKLLLERDPADAEAWSLRGQGSARKQHFRAAKEYFQEALQRVGFRDEKPRIPAKFPLRELVLEAAQVEASLGDATTARALLQRGLLLVETKEDKAALREALERR